jgi:DNA repair ATPase RecN
LVSKNGESSSAVILDENGRIDEIARIISCENPTQEAIEFAKALII